MERKQIAIFGYYGFENTGDDAVLESMLRDFRNQFDDSIKVIVFSNNPDRTEEQYKTFNITCIKWDNYALLNFAINQSDLLIIGGGGLYNCYLDYPGEFFLKGNHSYFSVTTFGLPLLAEIHATPCMVYGVGASEILNDKAKLHIGLGLEKCEAITVRDSKTKSILSKLTRRKVRIEVTGDPVFRLINEKNMNNEYIAKLAKVDQMPRPILGISLRNWDAMGDNDLTIAAVSKSVNYFHKFYSGSVVLLPFDNGGVIEKLSEDNLALDKLVKNLNDNIQIIKFEEYLEPSFASNLINLCDITLCMRLHPIVMSIKNQIPVIGLVYDQKVKNVMQMCGVENLAISIEKLNSKALSRKLFDIYDNRKIIRKKLKYAHEKMKKQAKRNVEYVGELLSSDGKLGSKLEFNISKKKGLLGLGCTMLRNFFDEKIFEDIMKYKKEQFEAENYTDVVRMLSLMRENDLDAQLTYELAFSLHQCNEYDAALYYYELALKKGFDEFWVRYNRGQLYLMLNDKENALKDFIEAKKFYASNNELKYLLEKCL